MHHFDDHETLRKNASGHFSVLILRFTMVVYLYNVKYFFVVIQRGPRRYEPSAWNKRMTMIRSGGGGSGEGLPLLTFIFMRRNFVTYCS